MTGCSTRAPRVARRSPDGAYESSHPGAERPQGLVGPGGQCRIALGTAVIYTLKNWNALCRYTEEGFLEMDNNTAERCMRPIALGRKNFLFVGSERAGHAAAIWYTLTESCKLNRVNPLTYITYLLENVRKKDVVLLRPDQFGSPGHDLALAS